MFTICKTIASCIKSSGFLTKSVCKFPYRMVVFTQKINGVTGTLEWDAKDDSYDYHQEIARSAFADMLHDSERNRKYLAGLETAVRTIHSQGRQANVLDIGTGTGLLSIMAAQCGADSVVACEAFRPMSDCAVKIIKDNGWAHFIKVIPKRSTELVVGACGDMETRANILVTEVFDTELIGEGALETFSHAHQELLEENCIVVPHSAKIYAQVVACPTLQKWNKLIDVADEDGDIVISTPPEVKDCSGSAAVHDIQLSQLNRTLFREITQPIQVLEYDWSGKTPLLKNTSTTITTPVLQTGCAQMVFMWWDLVMDIEGKVVLSCAPWWSHKDADTSSQYPQDTIPWRDHWMQAVYYFPTPLAVDLGDPVTLVSSQDEFSLWFDITAGGEKSTQSHQGTNLRPVCTCGVHMTYSRTHISYMNDGVRNKKMLRVINENVTKDSVVLCLNGGSLMGLAAGKMGAKKVVYVESSIIGRRILNNYMKHNKLENIHVVEDMEAVFKLEYVKDVSILLGDPDYSSSLLPWDNIHTAHVAHKYKHKFKNDLKVIPARCSLWVMAVEFFDLHKIKAPLNVCENVDLKLFDELIVNSRSISDDEIEPQPLWEYPCLSRSDPVQLIEISLQNTHQVLTCSGTKECTASGSSYNGFVFWVEWSLDQNPRNSVTTGPIVKPEINQRVSWDPHTRQGVKIMEGSCVVKEGGVMRYNVKCNLLSGNIHIDVDIE